MDIIAIFQPAYVRVFRCVFNFILQFMFISIYVRYGQISKSYFQKLALESIACIESEWTKPERMCE